MLIRGGFQIVTALKTALKGVGGMEQRDNAPRRQRCVSADLPLHAPEQTVKWTMWTKVNKPAVIPALCCHAVGRLDSHASRLSRNCEHFFC